MSKKAPQGKPITIRRRRQQLPQHLIAPILKKIYHKVDHPASYSSPYKLYIVANKVNSQIKLSDVKKWLTGEPSYTLHREIKLTFPRRKVVVSGMQIQYQADLVDYAPIARENKGTRFLLTVIDCFSRFASVQPLKNKTGIVVVVQLENAFKEMGFPLKLQTDQGGEFYNKHVKNLLEKKKKLIFLRIRNLKRKLLNVSIVPCEVKLQNICVLIKLLNI